MFEAGISDRKDSERKLRLDFEQQANDELWYACEDAFDRHLITLHVPWTDDDDLTHEGFLLIMQIVRRQYQIW